MSLDLDALDAKYSRDSSGLYRWWAVETIDADVHALLSALTATRAELDKSEALRERAANELGIYRRAENGHPALAEIRQMDDLRMREIGETQRERDAARAAADKLRAERDHLRKVLDAANATTEAAQRIVTAALADGTATIAAAAPKPDEPTAGLVAMPERPYPERSSNQSDVDVVSDTSQVSALAGAGDGEQDTATTERAA